MKKTTKRTTTAGATRSNPTDPAVKDALGVRLDAVSPMWILSMGRFRPRLATCTNRDETQSAMSEGIPLSLFQKIKGKESNIPRMAVDSVCQVILFSMKSFQNAEADVNVVESKFLIGVLKGTRNQQV